MQENQNTTVELVPDKDGFLFEIDDDLYILGKIFGVLFLGISTLILFIVINFEIMKLLHSGYRGHYIVYLGLPLIILESIRIIKYFYKKNYKKIKFYETYILKTNKNIKVELKDIKEGYFLKFNFDARRIIRNYLLVLLVFLIIPTIVLDSRFVIYWSLYIIYMYIMLVLSRYIYSLHKGNKTLLMDNIILIGKDDKNAINIPLQIINHEDKTLFESYIKKYLNKNINDFEKYILKVPLTKKENLINTETKIGESNGR